MAGLIGLLVFLLVLGLVYWVAHKIGTAFGIPAQIMVLVDVALVCLAVVYFIALLLSFFPDAHVPFIR